MYYFGDCIGFLQILVKRDPNNVTAKIYRYKFFITFSCIGKLALKRDGVIWLSHWSHESEIVSSNLTLAIFIASI